MPVDVYFPFLLFFSSLRTVSSKVQTRATVAMTENEHEMDKSERIYMVCWSKHSHSTPILTSELGCIKGAVT